MKSRVAVLRVTPQTILADIEGLLELADVRSALAPGSTTILKDNISWHFPFPGANTTPWQLEGVTLALRKAGYGDLVCVQNKTVVTNAFKGEDLNHYVPIFERHSIPVLYNFRDADMKWIEYRPKAKMRVLDRIFPEGIRIPDYFLGKNIVHLPTVKCVAGDTQVVLADGSRVAIRELAARAEREAPEGHFTCDGDERWPSDVEVLAMDDTGAIRPHRVTWIWRTRRGDRRVLQLRTRTGRMLTATLDHPVFTPDGWRPLGTLRPGDRVAIARSMAIRGAAQPLPQTYATTTPPASPARRVGRFSEPEVHEVMTRYLSGQTVTSIARSHGVPWQSIQYVLRQMGIELRGNRAQLGLPQYTSVDFWRWLGYVMAEGCVEAAEKGSHKLWWVNTNEVLCRDFEDLTNQFFGLQPRGKANGPGLHVYSRRLGLFLEELGLPLPLHAGNKRVPEMLFRGTNEEIAGFLSGYLDGDGSVSGRQLEITAVTKSFALARDLQDLCARLGGVAFVRKTLSTIPGKWDKPRVYWTVRLTGADAQGVGSHLDLRHAGKRRRLEDQLTRFAASKQPSNWDVVPLNPRAVREVREGLGLTLAATGRPSTATAIETGRLQPTPRVARDLLQHLSECDIAMEHATTIAAMRLLAREDLAWDMVVQVQEVEVTDLYDLTVPAAASFVGNGIVLHNCHIYTTTTGAMKNAFGGLLNTKRHYTHSWIHETLVDLLAIQKEIHSGLFAVMDGTTAGNGPGPRTMIPVVKDFMLASADQVAIDAVAAKMMGFDPMTIDYIRIGHEAGLGVGKLAEIEVVGTDVSNESWGFQVGDNSASRVGDLLWFGPFKPIQNFFFRSPLVHLFVFGSEAYHDFYRWPVKDRAVFERWLHDTGWGRLFEHYAREGALAPASAGPGRTG